MWIKIAIEKVVYSLTITNTVTAVSVSAALYAGIYVQHSTNLGIMRDMCSSGLPDGHVCTFWF